MPVLMYEEQLIRLADLAMAADLHLMEQQIAFEMRMEAMAGCTLEEAKYLMSLGIDYTD